MFQQLEQFIIHHWPQWLMLLGVIIAILLNEYKDKKDAANQLSVPEAVSFINENEATIFDLRDKERFQKAHIVDAINVTPAEFEAKYSKKYKNQPILIVCEQGLQSRQFANTLKTQGFVEAVVLAGGVNAWLQAGLPLIKGK